MIDIKGRWRAWALGGAVLAAVGCNGSDSELTTVTGTIRGTVTDVESGAPVAGASVLFGTTGGVTAPDGTYTLDGVPQGGLTLAADKAGYFPFNGWVVFLPATNGTLVRDIQMTPEPAETEIQPPAS